MVGLERTDGFAAFAFGGDVGTKTDAAAEYFAQTRRTYRIAVSIGFNEVLGRTIGPSSGFLALMTHW